jgi:hypothetical protein
MGRNDENIRMKKGAENRPGIPKKFRAVLLEIGGGNGKDFPSTPLKTTSARLGTDFYVSQIAILTTPINRYR